MEKGYDVKELQKECICEQCPTYVDCEEPLAFCVMGGSSCITNKQGCICPGCPVYDKLELNGLYFCMRSPE